MTPMLNLEALWREYNAFEQVRVFSNSLNLLDTLAVCLLAFFKLCWKLLISAGSDVSGLKKISLHIFVDGNHIMNKIVLGQNFGFVGHLFWPRM